MEYICFNCIGENYLKGYIKKKGTLAYCSYCQKMTKVVEFQDIIEIIEDGILFLYDDPANGLGWMDGEYVGNVQDSNDILADYFDFDVDDNVIKNINSYFYDKIWCKKEFYDLDDSEEGYYTWEAFKYLTKHKTRYFFDKIYNFTDDEYSKYKTPNDILNKIMKISKRLKLFKILKKGTIIYRARAGKYLSISELCSAEPQQCIYSNRFSPAGIPMFYGSDDIYTCMMEIDKKNDCSIGKWEILEDIIVYDLTYKFFSSNGQYFYKNFPSIFDKERRNYYHDYKFILDFASDICRKVIKNRDENIDYVPTQIVIEYFKLNIKSLRGISFYGATNGQKNYCLFLSKKQCLDGSLIKMIDSFYVK